MRYLLTFLPSLLLVNVAFAQAGQPTDFASLVDIFLGIIDTLVVLVFALTFLVFIWGITKAWILHGDNEEEIAKGKQLAVWGVIVFVIMSGIWGILAILKYSLFGV